ncbi:DUF7500 family protein [Halogeometricum limi]|uniref:Uncharacterized protein n=1 Tax=Halogeometricum limi TaxID=555875 RepID=A0A1I6GPD0_9EURY|nr:hypothetical protein [Halogeometricum limi]SFR44018.1 hypothetical protein SAMN04488124_1349 [Halogeometricum limi]
MDEADREPLTPDELDFRRDDRVTALGDGRYVVATSTDPAPTPRRPLSTGVRGRPGDVDAETDVGTDAADADTETDVDAETDGGVDTAGNGADAAATPTAVPDETALARESRDDPKYFVELAARTDEGTFETRIDGDDIGAVCASMLRWYARQVSPSDDPKKVLSVLLSRSEFGLRGPTADR